MVNTEKAARRNHKNDWSGALPFPALNGVAVQGIDGCLLLPDVLSHDGGWRSRKETTAHPSSSISRYRAFPYAAGDSITHGGWWTDLILPPSAGTRATSARDQPCPSSRSVAPRSRCKPYRISCAVGWWRSHRILCDGISSQRPSVWLRHYTTSSLQIRTSYRWPTDAAFRWFMPVRVQQCTGLAEGAPWEKTQLRRDVQAVWSGG